MGYGKGVGGLYPDLTFQCSPQVEAVVAATPSDAVIVDVGAGGRRVRSDVITIDHAPVQDTDIVSDAKALPFDDDSIDLLIATGLIEHLEDENAFLREALRTLKPNGRIHIEAPFLQQYHDDPVDHRRYTVSGIDLLMRQHGFDVEHSDFHIGPSVTITTLNAYYASLLFEGGNIVSNVLSGGAFLIVSLLGWPLKFLDKFLKNKKSAHRLAFGVYCTAVKPAAAASAS